MDKHEGRRHQRHHWAPPSAATLPLGVNVQVDAPPLAMVDLPGHPNLTLSPLHHAQHALVVLFNVALTVFVECKTDPTVSFINRPSQTAPHPAPRRKGLPRRAGVRAPGLVPIRIRLLDGAQNTSSM